jgi:hypothetical protein
MYLEEAVWLNDIKNDTNLSIGAKNLYPFDF